MKKEWTQIQAEMNLQGCVPGAKKPWFCKVCGNKFKSDYGFYNHIDNKGNEEQHDKAIRVEMNKIISDRLENEMS